MRRLNICIFFSMMSFFFVNEVNAATVTKCSVKNREQICAAKIDGAQIGDTVRILDDRARVVGTGRIVQKKRGFHIIKITAFSRNVRQGYPIIIEPKRKPVPQKWVKAPTPIAPPPNATVGMIGDDEMSDIGTLD